MTIVAHAHPFVIGVDTHARSHTIAILAASTGEPIATEQFPSTAAGIDRAIAWAARRTAGDLAALWVIEGVATYGARLAAAVDHAGYEVVEAARMDARQHRGTGKSDSLDARRIAAAVLSLEPAQLRRPRSDDGARAALRVLITAREHMTTERTASINALTALLRVTDLGIDARKPLSARQVSEVAHWRARAEALAVANRSHRGRPASQTRQRTGPGDQHPPDPDDLPHPRDQSGGPARQDRHRSDQRRGHPWGLVPRGRVRSEAAFAALAGGILSRHRRGTPHAIGSTEAAIDDSTGPFTWPSSLA